MRGEIELREVTKTYGATTALDSVSVRLSPGRVHALMGKNGSGKSTMVKLLAGAIQPTSGELWVNGAPARFEQPRDAFASGIMTVYQELSLVGQLSVGENIYLGRLPRRPGFGGTVVDWRQGARRRLAAAGGDGAVDQLEGEREHAQHRPAADGRDRQGDVVRALDPAA